MKFLLFVCLILFLPFEAFGAIEQETSNLDTELALVVSYLSRTNEEDRPYIKFLTFYGVPNYARENAILATSFWLHSLTGVTKDGSGNNGYYAPLAISTKDKFLPSERLVTGSNTLYWIDIRDYNWTQEVFEKISQFDPYVRLPWIDAKLYGQMRILGGNALISGPWFLAQTCDVTKQDDRNIAPYYYELLYAHVGIPKNATEYRNIWGVDVKNLEKFGLVKGTIVDKSIVSRHTRELASTRTILGYHWESSDYKTNDNQNDPLEFLSIERDENGIARHIGVARKADAHEYITSNLLGLQVYFLTNDKEERVEFGDPTVVRDLQSLTNDVRVKTARSCVVCHSVGINPPSNDLEKLIKSKVDLVAQKEFKRAIEQYYLTNINSRVFDDQNIFTRAVMQTNGLDPIENAKIFQQIVNWYDADISIEQAALECGVSVQEFKHFVGASTSLRLVALTEGQKIPRSIWENPIGGGFAQAMLLIKRLDSLPPTEQFVIITQNTHIKNGTEIIQNCSKGDSFRYIKTVDDWYEVRIDNRTGFIWNRHSKLQ